MVDLFKDDRPLQVGHSRLTNHKDIQQSWYADWQHNLSSKHRETGKCFFCLVFGTRDEAQIPQV